MLVIWRRRGQRPHDGGRWSAAAPDCGEVATEVHTKEERVRCSPPREASADGSTKTGGLRRMTGQPAGAARAEPPAQERDDGDAALYARVMADGFSGPVWERVADRLVRYGTQVLRGWIRTGEISSVCFRKGVKGMPAAVDWSDWADADIDDLVQVTVTAAIARFRRDGLAARGWRADRGASLTSWFGTACLFALAASYRAHAADRRRHSTALNAVTRQDQPAHVADAAEAIIEQTTVEEILDRITDPRVRPILQLTAAGYSYSEISALLADGTTARAVEALVYRYRKQTRGDRDGR